MKFVHLHVHTAYSINDATALIPQLVARARSLHMPALAITDHGNMHGVVAFYHECVAQGIKPILGCEVHVAGPGRKTYHLTLLAENNTGLCNLVRLVHSYGPAVTKEEIARHAEGLIALGGCIGGEVPRMLLEQNYEAALAAALENRALFAPDCFFIEITAHSWVHHVKINPFLATISEETGIPMVATNDAHMVGPEDGKHYAAIRNEEVDNDARKLYLMSEAEMMGLLRRFPQARQAMHNAARIAARCNVTLGPCARLSAPPPPETLEYIARVQQLTALPHATDTWVWEWAELTPQQQNVLRSLLAKHLARHMALPRGLPPGKKERRHIAESIKDALAARGNFPAMPALELKRIVNTYIMNRTKRKPPAPPSKKS